MLVHVLDVNDNAPVFSQEVYEGTISEAAVPGSLVFQRLSSVPLVVSAKGRDAGVRTVDDVRAHPQRLACLLPDARKTCLELKRFLRQKVYLSKTLNAERERSVQMIAELFQYFEADPARLPDPYREQVAARPAHNVICEYIAGMTDGYCGRQYHELIK